MDGGPFGSAIVTAGTAGRAATAAASLDFLPNRPHRAEAGRPSGRKVGLLPRPGPFLSEEDLIRTFVPCHTLSVIHVSELGKV